MTLDLLTVVDSLRAVLSNVDIVQKPQLPQKYLLYIYMEINARLTCQIMLYFRSFPFTLKAKSTTFIYKRNILSLTKKPLIYFQPGHPSAPAQTFDKLLQSTEIKNIHDKFWKHSFRSNLTVEREGNITECISQFYYLVLIVMLSNGVANGLAGHKGRASRFS